MFIEDDFIELNSKFYTTCKPTSRIVTLLSVPIVLFIAVLLCYIGVFPLNVEIHSVILIGIILFGVSYLIIGFSSTPVVFIIGVVLFFIGFNMHEPIMQSLASKFAKVHQRGLVLWIFTSAGYVGTFLGGMLGGMFYQEVTLSTLVIVIALICIIWAFLIMKMPNPAKKKFAYLESDLEKIKHDFDSIF